jgi:hypothetical protein
MLSPLIKRQLVLETIVVLTLITGLAVGLSAFGGFLEAQRHNPWLCQVLRVLSLYSFFVAAVIFCATITMIGIKWFMNMASHDAA